MQNGRLLDRYDTSQPPYNTQKRRKTGPTSFKKSHTFLGRSRLSTELKAHDNTVSTTIPNSAKIVNDTLAVIPQGVSDDERIGRKVVLKSIEIRGAWQSAFTAQTETNALGFMYLVLDTQANQSAPAIADIFNSPQLRQAMPNVFNSKRFKILKRWSQSFNVEQSESTIFSPSNKVYPFSYYKRVSIPINYTSTTGAVTEITENNLFLVCGSWNADDKINLDYQVRLRYVD